MSLTFTYAPRAAHVEFVEPGQASTVLGERLVGLDVRSVLLIASTRELPRARELVTAHADRIAGEFSGVRQHVPVEVADLAEAAANNAGADALLAIGGGSAIGAAKVVAHRTGLPIIAVPTTYSGSEMTATWGMTEGGKKSTAVDSAVAPRVVIYDPDLVAGLPREIAVPSAFNAMAHCIEALWVRRANPINDLVALEGVSALREGLDALGDGDADRARERLLFGAFLGGLALGSVGSGLHHKICHALGGAFDTDHALTHTVILPAVLAFNAPAVPDIANRIARALDSTDAVSGLSALYTRIGAPRSLPEIGLGVDKLGDAVAAVIARLPVENPRPVDEHEIEIVLQAAFGMVPATGQ